MKKFNSLHNDVITIMRYKHPKLGKLFVSRGKTKKFKLYILGYTFKKPFDDKIEVLWEDVKWIRYKWTESLINSMGTEKLELSIYDSKNYEVKIKFTFPVYMIIPFDWSLKNGIIVNLLLSLNDVFNFDLYDENEPEYLNNPIPKNIQNPK